MNPLVSAVVGDLGLGDQVAEKLEVRQMHSIQSRASLNARADRSNLTNKLIREKKPIKWGRDQLLCGRSRLNFGMYRTDSFDPTGALTGVSGLRNTLVQGQWESGLPWPADSRFGGGQETTSWLNLETS
jgi:hypothetical protein